MPRLVVFVAALLAPLAAFAQNTVFNDSFSADALNPSTYPVVTSAATGWIVASNKAAPAPTESGGILTINMAGTTAGFVETQALFAPSPVQLLPGTDIELTTTFVPTYILTTSADNFIVGLFNSGGSAPVSGLTTSGLSSALTTYATGGAQGWLGYNANIPLTGSSPKMLNRAAQTGANNTVQDVVVDSQSSSVGYGSPAGASASGVGSMATTLTNGSTYTLDYKLSLSADGATLTAAVALYNGTGTTGLGANTQIGSYSGTFTGGAVLTKAFDALAFGWRAGSGTSNPSNLQLSALTIKTTGGAPWISTPPPSSLMASTGSSLTINAVVGGTVSTYQWQVSTDSGATFTNIDSTANSSAATASLTIASVQAGSAGLYRLQATNSAGTATSSSCTVTVTAGTVAPAINTNPTGGTVTGGSAFTFSITANGTSPLAYQWQKSSDGTTYTAIAGATGASYAIAAVTLADEGYYRAVVTNSAGTATSTAAQLVVNQPLTITSQPTGATLNLGGSATLSVTAVGKPAPTYQWYLNGVALGGATSASYAITAAAAANAGIYTVVASNTAGDSATSTGAAVAVLSSTFAPTTFAPAAGATGVAPDARLTLTFNQAVAVGQMGTIKIYDTTNPTTPVDTIDLVAATASMKTLRAGSTISTQALPVQSKSIGGVAGFNYYPITVSGNTATVYPRNGVLTWGKKYYVTIDPGVFTDATGLSYAGIASATGWTFTTRGASPLSSAAQFVVAADGSGDFCTVQAALDFIPAGNTTPRTLLIRKGTYFEEIYFTGKHAITFLGEDRQQSVIVYPNNNTFNNASGTYHRMVFQADHVNNLVLANLTVTNSTPKGGSQAEAVTLNGASTAQAIITNVDLTSYQDTLLINGSAYIASSHISGDVDYMWGNGPCFFDHCELTALTASGYFTQIRNGSGNHGYVYSNCTLDGAAGVSGMYLARIDPSASNGFPYSEVVWLNCVMGSVSGTTYSTPVGPTGWLLNNTADQTAASAPNVHFWEYNSHYADGTALDVSSRIGASRQLTQASDAAAITNYGTPSWVLGNSWTPTLAPLVAVTPVAQTVNTGSGFTVAVQAVGLPAPTYQWQRDGVAIAGATNASYAVASAGSADGGMYSVVVSNSAGSTATTAVSVVVGNSAPVISVPPAGTSGLLGATATFSTAAAGSGSFTYQWNKNGAPLAGATHRSLRLTGLAAADAGNYTVDVSNGIGTTTSAAATLTIVTPATTLPTMPKIPAAVFDATSYGAVGDGTSDNTTAIQAALNAAKAAGGGTVEIPAAASPYLSGPITVYGSTDLQVDAGATLRALPYGTYPKSTTSPAHFITIASGATDVEFSGGGTIDGDGSAWWTAYNAGTISNRPRLVQIGSSNNLLFSGLTFKNSPMFHLAFSASNNVTIFGITISAPGTSPNTDGMDIAGTNFLVQKCNVSVGDDDIVAKPGGTFCRNFYIADCTIGTGHGVSIGGQTNVGLDGMTVTRCTFDGTSSALRFKADPTQGGPVQNVTFSNLTMANVTYPILFYSYYNQLGSPGATSGSSQTTATKVNNWNSAPPNPLNATTIPTWKNITVSNLTVTNGSGYCTIWGLPLADALIANVTLDNVTIQGGAGLELFDAANIQLTGTNSVGPIITCNALAITGQPGSQTINAGDSVTFNVTAVGGGGTNNTGLTYQWALNGTKLVDGRQADGSTVTGAATASLTVTNAQGTSAGNYTAVVSATLDGYNVATSSLAANSLPVSATSSPAVLTVISPNAPAYTDAKQLYFRTGAISYTPTFSGTVTQYSATGLPAGLTINSSTGQISGTVTSPGATTVLITGSGSAGSVTQSVAFNVTPATFTDSRLVNISLRSNTTAGDKIATCGFYIAGGTKLLLARLAGPALIPFGVTGTLVQPTLKLYDGNNNLVATYGAQRDSSDPVGISQASSYASAFPFPAGSTDAAAVLQLAAGQYTLQAIGAGDASGVGLVELYDLDRGAGRFTNLSTRGEVGTGGAVMIDGFVVDGPTNRTVLIRAVGPTLGNFGVGGVLLDPKLTVKEQTTGTVMGGNDNWQEGQDGATIIAANNKAGAFQLLSGSKDAAVVLTLPPGQYSVVVEGVNGTTGVALAEVYDISN